MYKTGSKGLRVEEGDHAKGLCNNPGDSHVQMCRGHLDKLVWNPESKQEREVLGPVNLHMGTESGRTGDTT